MPWHLPEGKTWKAGKAYMQAACSMSDIIFKVLEAVNTGSISPVDAHALDIVRSLRNASINGFDFKSTWAGDRNNRFPDNVCYEESLLDNDRLLLDLFRNAANLIGITRSLSANSLHTSIGIPAKASPEKGQNNTLCRIITVSSYEEAIPIKSFVLELTKAVYEARLDKVAASLAIFPIKAMCNDKSPEAKEYFHENGKNEEKVYRITFDIGQENLESKKEVIVKAFQSLLLEWRSLFQS